MIDLTPLDVRKKRGDFTKALRGYETQQVDSFLELVAERLEELVKENLTLAERVERLAEQVEAQTGREKAVNDALVTAQQLRQEISTTAEREAELIRSQAQAEGDRLRSEADRDARDLRVEVEREVGKLRVDAEAEARSIVSDAERRVEELHHVMRELERRRARFLTNFRQLLERELDTVEVQEARNVDEDMPVDLDLGGPAVVAALAEEQEAPEDEVTATDAGDELFGDLDDGEEANIVDDGIRAEPLGVFDPVEKVPPVRETHAEEPAPWAAEDSEESRESIDEGGRGPASDADPAPDDVSGPPALDEPRQEKPVSSFFTPPASPPEEELPEPTDADPAPDVPGSPEVDHDLRLPSPDSDVHRLATDTRLSADPPNSGLEWLESEESDDDR